MAVDTNATLLLLSCDRSYVVRKVPSTNLYLLVLQADCVCDNQMEDILYHLFRIDMWPYFQALSHLSLSLPTT